MRIAKLIPLGLLLVLLLVACGGGAKAPSQPTDTMKQVIQATQEMDLERVSELFCAERQGDITQGLEASLTELEQMGLDQNELLDAIQLKIANEKYETVSQSDNEAVVRVSGDMSLQFDAEKMRNFMKKAAEASGQTVSDEELDFMVSMFSAIGGQEAPIDAEVKLIKENNKWVVCDDLNFLDSADLFQLP
jgi:hypothetical protein